MQNYYFSIFFIIGDICKSHKNKLSTLRCILKTHHLFFIIQNYFWEDRLKFSVHQSTPRPTKTTEDFGPLECQMESWRADGCEGDARKVRRVSHSALYPLFSVLVEK